MVDVQDFDGVLDLIDIKDFDHNNNSSDYFVNLVLSITTNIE